MIDGRDLVLIALAAMVVASVGVGVVRRVARAQHIFDTPNERSLHTHATPRGGGLVIATLVLAAAVFSTGLTDVRTVPTLWWLSAALLLISVVSFFDDVRRLPMSTRFVAQLAAAMVALLGLAYSKPETFGLVSNLPLGVVILAVCVLWVVGLTNAYNFMDGIDGIAGIQAVAAGSGWALLGWLVGRPDISLVGTVVAGGSAGFLIHNWAPARIFMGDVGSVSLGFTFAMLTVIAVELGPRFVVAGPLLLWPFLFDTTFTLCRRLARREHVFSAHRTHLYQRLVIAGYTHRAVATIYGVLAAIGFASAVATALGGTDFLVVSLIVIVVAGFTLWRSVVRAEKAAARYGDALGPTVSRTPLRTS